MPDVHDGVTAGRNGKLQLYRLQSDCLLSSRGSVFLLCTIAITPATCTQQMHPLDLADHGKY